MIPKYARYKYCIEKSIEFIFNETINKFPFDSDIIIKRHKWARIKYEDLAEEHNLSLSDIIKSYQSEDGYSIYTGRNYTIAYNNTHIPKRIYFTKLHEIGHIYLNHFIDFEETILSRSNMSKSQYKVLENEANCFARNVIAPAVIVKNLKLDTTYKVANYFGITLKCAKTRLDLLKYDLKYISKEDQLKQLSLFEEYLFKKRCLKCENGTTDKNTLFCPICGHNKLTWGYGNMIYKGIEVNENSKALICPKCTNEQIYDDGDYCKICGTYLINKCSNTEGYQTINEFITPCGELVDGNARYCHRCGEKTTFYNYGFLSDWEQEKDIFEFLNDETESSQNLQNPHYDDVPF